jgi:predicted GIY-YIG superfamily endonuclease
MTHKIYLIKHLDTGMGYVGITGDELGKRWYQHLHDPASAVYKALRAEGHRMSMQLLEEVETRAEALTKEQMYIHALGTAQPMGWNRQVKLIAKPKPKQVRWIQKEAPLIFDDGELRCPVCWKNDGTCDGEFLYFNGDSYHPNDDEEITRFPITCEVCHLCDADCSTCARATAYVGVDEDFCFYNNSPSRPKYELEHWGTHGRIEMRMIVYIKADV